MMLGPSYRLDKNAVTPTMCFFLFVLFLLVQLISIMTVWVMLGTDPDPHEVSTIVRHSGWKAELRSSETLIDADSHTIPEALARSMPALPPNLPQLGVDQQNAIVAYLVNKNKDAAREVKRLVKVIRKGPATSHIPDRALSFDYSSLLPAKCNSAVAMKFATYNLWGSNPPWPQRRDRIARIITTLLPDVMVVQEVRNVNSENQLRQLASLISSSGYNVIYQKVSEESAGEEEGIGIISRHPILSTSTFVLTSLSAPPSGNEPAVLPPNRACVHALINSTTFGLLNVFATHLSLTDFEQCRSVVQLLEQFNSENFDRSIPQILLGDMSTYFDYEWPMDFLTQKSPEFASSPLNPCSRFLREYSWPKGYAPFRDAWEMTRPRDPGHTFPTFQDSRIQDSTRSDRIFARHHSTASLDDMTTHLIECGAATFGGDESVFLHEGKAMYPSDHRGVVASYILDPRPDLTYADKARDVRSWVTGIAVNELPLDPAQPLEPAQSTSSDDAAANSDPSPSVPEPTTPVVDSADGVPPLPVSQTPRANVPVALTRPASVVSSMTDYKFADDREYHGPEKAFDGSLTTFFWSDTGVKRGDHLTIILTTPEKFKSITVYTGHVPVAGRENEPLRDSLTQGVLEVAFLQVGPTGGRSVTPFKALSSFQGGMASATLEGAYPNAQSAVHSIRVKATSSSDSWLVIREVVVT